MEICSKALVLKFGLPKFQAARCSDAMYCSQTLTHSILTWPHSGAMWRWFPMPMLRHTACLLGFVLQEQLLYTKSTMITPNIGLHAPMTALLVRTVPMNGHHPVAMPLVSMTSIQPSLIHTQPAQPS